MNARTALSRGLVFAGVVAAASHPLGAAATVSFQVSFDDPGALHSSYYDRIRSNLVSAGSEWASYLGATSTASVQVLLSFADIATANGASVTNSYVGLRGGLSTYEQGAAYEARTGRDPNGSAPDIRMTIGDTGYLQNELWFDPSPTKQTTAVPLTRTDARSVFLHELGHAFVFNGWRDGKTGALPGTYQSTFDSLVKLGTSNGQPQLFFTGGSARSLYGGSVPLTFGNYGHVGNAAPRAGSNLIPDLMNGVSFTRGSRYHISPLDLAMLGDSGFPVSGPGATLAAADLSKAAPVSIASAVPEPSTTVFMIGGLMALMLFRARGRLGETFARPSGVRQAREPAPRRN